MVYAMKQREKVSLLTRMAALQSYFDSRGDTERTKKAEQLAMKLHDGEYAIAFCGHFSAGKSSIINQLVGEDILPSSPIPTSANLVKVKAGEDYAKVYFHLERPHLYPAPYNYEEVKAYCKDGDQINAIEISYSQSVLPEGAVIMDTPGIDSTDDAHRIATESALHLADVVFYVMDYNHVQSELNFLFTKELVDSGKDLYLIVNQIDKHRSDEISFTRFQESVMHSFASWGVKPQQIFYTSLKEHTHTYNEFSELRQFIEKKIVNRKQLLPPSVTASAAKLAKEHVQYVTAEREHLIFEQEQRLAKLSTEERDQLPERLARLENSLAASQAHVEKMIFQFDEETRKILKNAYLMPYQIRELAKMFLQAHEPGFKVGLFFSKQKTAAERDKRRKDFYRALQQTVEVQLDWHLKEHAQQTLKKNELDDPELLQIAQSISVQFEEDLLEKSIKEGARLSGNYVLHYTDDVANGLKRLASIALHPFKDRLIDRLENKVKRYQQTITSEVMELKNYMEAEQILAEIHQEIHTTKMKIEQLLNGVLDEKKYSKHVQMLIEKWQSVDVIVCKSGSKGTEKESTGEKNALLPKETNAVVATEEAEFAENQLSHTIHQLQFTANEIKDIRGFTHIAEDLLERADRLSNRGFTVALFGAFSAGKSSFANALIGEKLLPVSPNPTTATINKIMPVDDGHPHGTAKVKLKSSDDLLEDVNNSLRVFQLSATSLNESLQQIEKLLQSEHAHDATVKIHYAFLAAFYRGFSAYQTNLDETLLVNIAQFQEFVALEEKSCLVEWIEVYVDCELTRKGITLVDTPGADSINARHTSVAFDYIKNSDACFFVTYYNHAFSQADREFLIQLGRVKDSFELDKMFFIINAIDLANSSEEITFVENYVTEQLVSYGIRQPNISSVSSLLALEEKQMRVDMDQSQLKQFEKKFYDFLDHELLLMAVTSGKLEIQRVLDRLNRLISASYADEAMKEKNRQVIHTEKTTARQLVTNQTAEFIHNRLTQETDELVYYIKQRVFLRFGDLFKESVNPTILKEDGRNLKQALAAAIDNFLTMIGFDFAQEMRATTLRLEAFIKKVFSEVEEALITQLAELNEDFSFSSYELTSLSGIEFENAFIEIDHQHFKQAFTYFKNPKAFFEKNDRQRMSDAIESKLQEPAKIYLTSQGKRLKTHYLAVIHTEFDQFKRHFTDQLEEFYDGMLAVYSDEFQVARLEEVKNKIDKVV